MEQSKFYQIKNITEQEYTLVGCDGSVITRPIRDIDKSASAFTIQDAKDGDILCTYECDEPKIVFILKGTPKKHYALSYHCYYNIMYPHFGPDSEKGCLAPKDEDIKPATKEQRDTLLKAMADAGYTFEFEKKELKKIENETEIPYGAKDSELQEATYYIPKGFHVEIDDDKMVIKKGENPTVWSEDDKERIKNILSVLDVQVCWDGATMKKRNPYQKEIDWLKSLKDRYTWKPSDAQINVLLSEVTGWVKRCYKQIVLESLYNDLKKLK